MPSALKKLASKPLTHSKAAKTEPAGPRRAKVKATRKKAARQMRRAGHR